MKTIRILILEDDLQTLAEVMNGLFKLEENSIGRKVDFAVTVFSEYTQVEDYLNQIPEPNFDIILLDRDCKLGGSFHAIDIQKFGADRFISISSIPKYNETAAKMGIKRIVHKEYDKLSEFIENLLVEIREMI